LQVNGGVREAGQGFTVSLEALTLPTEGLGYDYRIGTEIFAIDVIWVLSLISMQMINHKSYLVMA